ncbi:hypothetical protein MNBD_BACTEROID01-1381 [hydrothermal vent metagenome]|uniref:Endonuclease/exonuclease/phosphatase domain-containing protein n=1 Tax=hydrothermal vent metagenome TaxID=652676 RepID=A0A3B0U133_9ZZZZ
MRKITLAFVCCCALAFLLSCSGGKYNTKRNLTVVFYNVENLFDIFNEPGKHDGEFTPEGVKKWTEERYNKKLADLSKVLSSINHEELPELIGLCEVENREVVEELLHTGGLQNAEYRVVHFESPDFRGIDVALAYRAGEFSVIAQEPIHISFENNPGYHTRDILYVKGRTNNREVFHIFVNHWPSRIGGAAKTEPKRIFVAAILRSRVDSILSVEPNANIIIMGDMNDEPANKSLESVLKASYSLSSKDNGLVNLMFKLDKEGKGSYKYRGKWNMLDNLVVSSGLFDKKGFRCTGYGVVFHKKWMEYKNRNGSIFPNRTYGGPNYYGGISDHFPVYFRMVR